MITYNGHLIFLNSELRDLHHQNPMIMIKGSEKPHEKQYHPDQDLQRMEEIEKQIALLSNEKKVIKRRLKIIVRPRTKKKYLPKK